VVSFLPFIHVHADVPGICNDVVGGALDDDMVGAGDVGASGGPAASGGRARSGGPAASGGRARSGGPAASGGVGGRGGGEAVKGRGIWGKELEK